VATDFFKTLYSKHDDVKPDDMLHLLQTKVSKDMNNDLCKDFTEEEIGDALFQIGPTKAPGIDGYPTKFFQRNLELIRGKLLVLWVISFEQE
jgi:hypothetical protein